MNPIAKALATADKILAADGIVLPTTGYTVENMITGETTTNLTESAAEAIIWEKGAKGKWRLISPTGAKSVYIR